MCPIPFSFSTNLVFFISPAYASCLVNSSSSTGRWWWWWWYRKVHMNLSITNSFSFVKGICIMYMLVHVTNAVFDRSMSRCCHWKQSGETRKQIGETIVLGKGEKCTSWPTCPILIMTEQRWTDKTPMGTPLKRHWPNRSPAARICLSWLQLSRPLPPATQRSRLTRNIFHHRHPVRT
jgi:hypothetical protein